MAPVYGGRRGRLDVRGLSKAAAVEYGDQSIRVSSVHPGAIWTETLASMETERSEAFTSTPPMKRMGPIAV